MKILNLYCGIGGNRKLWGDEHEITAVEIDPEIAKVYQDLFPKDKVIVGDAHEYLLSHYKEFDFIWSSPPCPTHSDIRRCAVHAGKTHALYPDMTLYQEIIFLTHFGRNKWVVENVVPYYEPLIPGMQIERHLFWANFFIIRVRDVKNKKIKHTDRKASEVETENYQENLYREIIGSNKRCVWKINTGKFEDAHFAVFPEKLVEPMIKSGCPKGGIVLDIFMGSGTTAVVASNLDRKYLGIELNKKYIKMAEDRLKPLKNRLF